MILRIWQQLKYFLFRPADQQIFLEDISSMIDDGVPPRQAFLTYSQIVEGLPLQVAQEVLQAIAEGKPIADGLENWFEPHIVEIVRAGEVSGTLARAMHAAAVTLTQSNTIITSLLNALIYPITVIILGLGVTVFLNKSIFVDFAKITPVERWPSDAQHLVAFSHFLEHGWLPALIALVLVFFLTAKFLRSYIGSARTYIDRVPILSLYRQATAARIMEILGILISNGVILKKAIRIMQDKAHPYLAWHLLSMEHRLGSGKDNIADVLDTGLIDQPDLMRLRVIARSKGFEQGLLRQGKHASERNLRSVQQTAKFIGGLLLLMGALLAATLIFSIYGVGATLAT